MEIREVDHGIANNFGTHIEINKNLKNYPKLYSPILEHELSHTIKISSIKDVKLDFISSSKISSIELFKFMIKYPKSFSQLLPFYYTKKKGFVFDINLIVMYLIMICIIVGGVYIGTKI